MNWIRRNERVEDVGEGLDRERLGEAGDALEEQVAAGEEGDEHALEHRVLADDDAPDLVEDGLGGLPGVAGSSARTSRAGGRSVHGDLRPVGTGGAMRGRRGRPRRDRTVAAESATAMRGA